MMWRCKFEYKKFFGSITIFCSPRNLRKIHSAACGLKKYYLRQNFLIFVLRLPPFFKGGCSAAAGQEGFKLKWRGEGLNFVMKQVKVALFKGNVPKGQRV